MSRPKTFTITPQSDADGICASQTPAAGGEQSLTIAGALTSGGKYSPSSPHIIEIVCAGNETSRTFTITGKDHSGQPVTEDVGGANAGTASSTGYFIEVSAITVDDNTAGAITVGVSGLCSSPWYPVDRRNMNFGLGIAINLSNGASLTYSIQHTYSPVQTAGATINWFTNDSLQDVTSSQEGGYDIPPEAIRLIVSSFTSGTASFTLVPRG